MTLNIIALHLFFSQITNLQKHTEFCKALFSKTIICVHSAVKCLTLYCPSSPVSFSVHSRYMSTDSQRIVGGILVGTSLWVTIIMIMRTVLKSLLSWHGWMEERHGSLSWSSRIWMVR